MKTRRLGLGIAALALGACVGVVEPLEGQTIDSTYVLDGARWKSGPLLLVMVRTFNATGKVGICGAWSTCGATPIVHRVKDDAIAAGRVVLDGYVVVEGLGFMQEHDEATDLRGATATCVRTSLDWQEGFAETKPDVGFPRLHLPS